MLRASLIAIVAVSLAACDEETETVVEETGAEVEVATETAVDEVAETADDAELVVEDAAEDTAEAVDEAAGEEDVGDGQQAAAEAEVAEDGEETVLTSDSPAVETTILTEADTEEVEAFASEGESAEEGADAGQTAESGDEAEGEELELAAAETDAEPAADGDAMQRYEEWVQGRWAPSASCESGVVELEQNALSLPGDVSCSEIEVASSGDDALAITGSSCEGAGDLDQVELEVTQTDDGIAVARDGQEASLVRCE